MTLEGTPEIVAAAGIQGLRFLDEAETVDRYARILRRRHGVRAIVVLLREGGFQATPFGINTGNGISGSTVDIVNRTTDRIDLIITGQARRDPGARAGRRGRGAHEPGRRAPTSLRAR